MRPSFSTENAGGKLKLSRRALLVGLFLWTLLSAFFFFRGASGRHSKRNSVSDSSGPLTGRISCSSTLIEIVQNISQSFMLKAQESKSENLLPPIIHQVWLGDKPFPETFLQSQKSFIEQNPDFYYALWRDDDVNCLIERFFPALVPIWTKLPRTILRADLLRYMIIFTFGGFYSDTDTLCLRPIRSWPKVPDARAVVGLEAEFSHLPNWRDMIVSRQIQVSVWTLASSPLHPLYAMAIQRHIY